MICESVLNKICILLTEVEQAQAANVRQAAVTAVLIDNESHAVDLVLHQTMFHLQSSHMRDELHNISKIISPVFKLLLYHPEKVVD